MVFPIAGGTQDTGYEISNSLRFNSGDSPELTRTFGSAGGDTWSYSCWLKRGDISQQGHGLLLDPNTNAGLYFLSTGALVINDDGSSTHTSTELLRDPNAWYHILFTGNGTTNKVYVNNSQLTFSGGTPNIGNINNNIAHSISKSPAGVGYMDGYLSEIHFVDGTEKAPTDFAEFNDNAVWIPKQYTGSYGTNGFFLEFKQTGTSANSSGIGADTSGNDNHMSVTNLAAIDVTTDTPTNNFCTLNPLSAKTLTFSEGNLHATNNGGAGSATGTIAPTNGKWYFEITLSGAANFAAGVVNLDDWASGTDIYSYGEAAAVLIENNANYNVTYGNTASSPSTLQTGTQLQTAKYGFAMDIDNNDLYVSANGNWYTGSAFDNTSFSSASAVTTDLPSNVPLTAFIRNPDSVTARCNFGNPAGADTISSGNADANGYGNFEYAVPSGYYSLCTKNLAEYG